jgi:hypothetical protein
MTDVKPDSANAQLGNVQPDAQPTRPINTRLALLASMAQAFDRFPASAADWGRFKPPTDPPKLQKPNRKARRALAARKRKIAG